jgi:hypothetical protein
LTPKITLNVHGISTDFNGVLFFTLSNSFMHFANRLYLMITFARQLSFFNFNQFLYQVSDLGTRVTMVLSCITYFMHITLMVFNATCNNISVILDVSVSFIGRTVPSTLRIQPTCCKLGIPDNSARGQLGQREVGPYVKITRTVWKDYSGHQ